MRNLLLNKSEMLINVKNTVSHLYFNKEDDYSEENRSENEDFLSTILQPFLFEPEQKKRVVMGDITKKFSIFTLQLPISYILE